MRRRKEKYVFSERIVNKNEKEKNWWKSGCYLQGWAKVRTSWVLTW